MGVVLSGGGRAGMGGEEGVEFGRRGHRRGAADPATTIAAAADPRRTASSHRAPRGKGGEKPAEEASPAPVGFSASVG
jgi:hypothetical protein